MVKLVYLDGEDDWKVSSVFVDKSRADRVVDHVPTDRSFAGLALHVGLGVIIAINGVWRYGQECTWLLGYSVCNIYYYVLNDDTR